MSGLLVTKQINGESNRIEFCWIVQLDSTLSLNTVGSHTPSVMSTRCTSMQKTNRCLRGLSGSGFVRIFGIVTRQALRSHNLSADMLSPATSSRTPSWQTRPTQHFTFSLI